MSIKRSDSVSDPSTSSSHKKIKVESELDTQRRPPHDKLTASALWYEGGAYWLVTEGEHPGSLAGISRGAFKEFTFHHWNEEHSAFEYRPTTNALAFTYTRCTYVGVDTHEEGGIIGDNISPVVRVCTPGGNPWVERFEVGRENPQGDSGLILQGDAISIREHHGPPFRFYEQDFACGFSLEPDGFATGSTCIITPPDLPKQPDGEEPMTALMKYEKTGHLGWQGDWVSALLSQRRRMPVLGLKKKTVEDYNASWKIDVELVPLALETCDVDHYESDLEDEEDQTALGMGLEKYTVSATINRLYIKPKFFEEPPSFFDPEDGKSGKEEAGTNE